MLVNDRAPVAAETPSRPLTIDTVEASSVPRRMSVISRDWLRVVVPSLVAPSSAPKSKRGPPPRCPGSLCAPVTVRSVPTP